MSNHKKITIAIAGLGTVGSAVLTSLIEKQEQYQMATGCQIVIAAVSARGKHKQRAISLAYLEKHNISFEEDATQLAKKGNNIDIIIELIGGHKGIAYDVCSQALKNGKHVITANKALIAHFGGDLAKLAEASGRSLLFEAAVAGAIPIIKLLRDAFLSNSITSIAGVLNGTCNYILTKMEDEGLSFQQALSQAQDLGYAEADPSFDIGGIDAAHKTAIISAMNFGSVPYFEKFDLCGIENITLQDVAFAKEFGFKIRLLGISTMFDGKISQKTLPCLVDSSSALASIKGAENAILIEGDLLQKSLITGQGAGALPTASAVISDLLEVAQTAPSSCNIATISDAMGQQNYRYPFIVPYASLKQQDAYLHTETSKQLGQTQTLQSHNQERASFYIKITAEDTAGMLSKITSILADCGISIAKLSQKQHCHDTGDDADKADKIDKADIAFITDKILQDDIVSFLQKIKGQNLPLSEASVIRIF